MLEVGRVPLSAPSAPPLAPAERRPGPGRRVCRGPELQGQAGLSLPGCGQPAKGKPALPKQT